MENISKEQDFNHTIIITFHLLMNFIIITIIMRTNTSININTKGNIWTLMMTQKPMSMSTNTNISTNMTISMNMTLLLNTVMTMIINTNIRMNILIYQLRMYGEESTDLYYFVVQNNCIVIIIYVVEGNKVLWFNHVLCENIPVLCVWYHYEKMYHWW